MLPDDDVEIWDRQIEMNGRDPHLGSLKPTGQPPTSDNVVNFCGSLQELVEAAALAQSGAVFDLNGSCVQVRIPPAACNADTTTPARRSPSCQCK